MKIGFIGCGKMGEAILNGILKKGVFKSRNIYFFDPNKKKKNYIKNKYKINYIDNPKSLVQKGDIILLAVKPQNILDVLNEIKGSLKKQKLIISIAAGIKISTIKKIIGKGSKVVRIMPNTPCLIGKGISVLSPGKSINKNSLKIAEKIFLSLGKVIVLNENHLNSVTALSGSGPAFFYRLAQSFIDAGKKSGLNENISKELVLETMIGAAEMIKNTNKTINQLVEDVSSPKGTTVAGRNVLEKSDYKNIINETIKAAKKRAEELSKG